MKGSPDSIFAKNEMMMPILPIIRVPDFEVALSLAIELENGYHHTAIIHSQNITRLNKISKYMNTAILVKNGPSYAGIGYKGEGPASFFTIATFTGEGCTTAKNFTKCRRCILSDSIYKNKNLTIL